MMKEIMNRAWEIARRAENRFGYRASEYIAGAMKMAWAEAKEDRIPASDEKVVRLGNVHSFRYDTFGDYEVVGKLNIDRETAKAVMVSFVGKIVYGEDDEDETNWTVWLPKSQIKIRSEYVIMKNWLVSQKKMDDVVA